MQLPLAELDRSLLQTLLSHSCLISMINHIHNQAASNHDQATIKVKSVSFTTRIQTSIKPVATNPIHTFHTHGNALQPA